MLSNKYTMMFFTGMSNIGLNMTAQCM